VAKREKKRGDWEKKVNYNEISWFGEMKFGSPKTPRHNNSSLFVFQYIQNFFVVVCNRGELNLFV
jgi:hypothetical protein